MKRQIATSLFLMLFAFVGTISAQLPSVSLKTIDGKAIDTATLSNDGKPFIIDFFATWCKPCNRELDNINEVYEEWKEETGVKIFIVSVDRAQDIHKVKPLVDSHEWEYDVLLDPNSEFFRACGGTNAYPFTIVVDGDGKVAYKHSGYVDGAENELIEKVRELIK